MKIIKKSTEEFTLGEMYNLTRSPKTRKMSDVVGMLVEPKNWLIYEEADKDGNPVTILAIETKDGDMFATNSATFIREFDFIANMCADFDRGVDCIEVVSGTSKNGRSYITCAFVEV